MVCVIEDAAVGDRGAGSAAAQVDSIVPAVGHGRVGDREIGPGTRELDHSFGPIPVPSVRDVTVIHTALTAPGECEIIPVPGGRGSLAGGNGDVLARGPFGHEGAADVHPATGIELDGDARAEGQGLAAGHGDIVCKAVIDIVIVPCGRIVSQAVHGSPRDPDGIGAVARKRHGAGDPLDPVGVHLDGIAPVIRNGAVADGRETRGFAVYPVAGAVLDGAVGDGGSECAGGGAFDSVAGAVGQGGVGDRNVGAGAGDVEHTLPNYMITAVREVTVVEAARAIRILQNESHPVPGGRAPFAGGKCDVAIGGAVGHDGAEDLHRGDGVELDGDPRIEGQGLAVVHLHIV